MDSLKKQVKRLNTEPVPDILYDEVRSELVRALTNQQNIMDRARYSQFDKETNEELSGIIDRFRNILKNSLKNS